MYKEIDLGFMLGFCETGYGEGITKEWSDERPDI